MLQCFDSDNDDHDRDRVEEVGSIYNPWSSDLTHFPS